MTEVKKYRPKPEHLKWHGNVEYDVLHVHTYLGPTGVNRTHAMLYWRDLEESTCGVKLVPMSMLTLECYEVKPFFEVGKSYSFENDPHAFKVLAIVATSDGKRQSALAEYVNRFVSSDDNIRLEHLDEGDFARMTEVRNDGG